MKPATLLVRPGAFFRDRREELNGITGAIVLLAVAVAITTVLAVVGVLFIRLVGGTGVNAGVSWGPFLGTLPLFFVAFLGVGLGLAVLLYLGAKLGRGTGSFGATVEVTAWGLVPVAIAVVVGALAFLAFASQVDFPGSGSPDVMTALQPVQSGPSGLVLLAIQLAGAGWQAYVWAAGLRVVHGMHRLGAVALAVLVATTPVILF